MINYKSTAILSTEQHLYLSVHFVLINVNFSIFNYSIIYMVDVHLCLWPILFIGKFDALGRAKTTMKMNWFCCS